MIYVDRSKVSCPEVLSQRSGSPAKLERAKAKVFYEKGLHFTGQRRFAFTVYKNHQVRDALTRLFHGKCAYCEATLETTGALDVELFRPKGGVMENPNHPGYWWLAMVWENMLPSCVDCNRTRTHDGIRTGKGDRFPLENESNRAFKPSQETREKPLLLDPCVDDPAKHLVFEESGMVISDTGRGQTTISVFGLNRPHLVEARHKAGIKVISAIRRFRDLTRDGLIGAAGNKQLSVIRQMTLPEEEFAGMKRQLIAARVGDFLDLGTTEKRFGYKIRKISKQRIKHAKVVFSEFEVEQSSYSLHDVASTDLPSPADLRVDQLLTSDFFGLNSTSDPDVEELFDRYYALLALPKPTSQQLEETDKLRGELKNRRYLGTTLRENLMYEAVDRIVAQHKSQPAIPSAELKEAAVAEVANVWNENEPPKEATPSR